MVLEELFNSDQTKRVACELDRATASNLNSAPICTYFAYNGQDAAASCSDVNAASASNRFDSEAKASLIRALSRDSKAELATQTKRLFGELDRATASKLLHLCCNFDSAECASAILGGDLGAVPLLNECDDSGKLPLHTAATAHAPRCVEVLLKKHARTDLRTEDGQAQLALELSLADTRIDLKTWNPKDFCVDDLVNCLTEKHTLSECLVREALALGGRATPPLRAAKRASTATEEENSETRKLFLREIELLQLFGAVAQSGGGEKKVTSTLIRAAQGGDEAVIQLLLKTNLDVNDADAEGNTALHWILKQPRLLCPQQIKILSLLLDHGARVSQRNRLGLTAFHIAAGNGNSEALEVLLLEDPVGVQYKTEMKETPLFFAVKNDSKECVELLLTWGANSEVLNLCKQRAIDLATSQDMCYTILNPTTVSLINHAFPNQHKCTALVLTDEDTTTTTERNLNSSTKAEVCKYFDSHRGCVRVAKCFYAHCEEESRKVKEGVDQSYSLATKLLKHKVFVGGFPPSVDSDDLGKFCEEEFEKMSPQRDQEQNFRLLQQKSNENIMEGDNPEQGSWADRLVHGQPTVCSTRPQITKGSENPRTPTWLKVFKKWFPGFLKGLSKHPNYALSSLKADFRAKFVLELDHSSVGHSKLSDFLLKCFSNICTVEMCPTGKRGNPPTHMILRPKVSRPKRRLLPTLGTPHNLSLSALIVNGGDSMCVSDLSTCDGGDSKCLQNLSVDNGGDSKCIQNLTIDTCSDTKCFQDLTADNTIDSKCLEDLSVHGTTCIGWVAEEFVILAADSRATLDGKIFTDTRDKFKILTPRIVATHAGTSSETADTCEYMERQMSDDIKTGKDVNSIWRLGELCKERELSDKENICHILIGGIQDEVPRCCSVFNIKGSSGSDWVEWNVMGSGGRYIRKMLEGLYRKLGDKAPWNDVVNGVGYLMLVAALSDPSTGGILSVQQVGQTNIVVHICLSVIELIIKFYTTQLSYILADGVKEETRMSFQQTEGRMIFLFYKCNEINAVELETWLGIEREEKIKNYGHPLTELADGYHAHRVEFKSCKSRDKFFRGAETLNQEITIQFTSRREFFKFYVLENQTIFVACQTLDMLKSLELSEKMKGKTLVRKTS